jgi:large subunit ribosomal protein L18
MQTKLNKMNARRNRVRGKLREQVGRPRLSIFRSNAHVWAQIIDDVKKTTLASANDLKLKGTKIEKATEVGNMIAKAGKAAKCVKVVFDRGSYRFHGRVKALATAARAGGLEF